MDARPIATSSVGAPLLYGALGAAFHLESLGPEDGEALSRASAAILDAIGPALRWTWSSVHPFVQPFTGSDLQLMPGFCGQLVDRERRDDPRAQRGASAMAAARYDRFGLACHGARERNDASPTTFRFYARVAAGEGGRFVTRAMIAFTYDESHPLEAFAGLVDAVAAALPLRWGSAGLAYGAWELDRYGETRDAIYAHARRHPGFDVGQHATLMDTWHRRLRTVSWLTFVGPALASGLRTPSRDPLVEVTPFGEGVRIRAGERPEPGDANRLAFPRAYLRADRIASPVRAREGVHFFAPWSEATTEGWLRRFERPE